LRGRRPWRRGVVPQNAVATACIGAVCPAGVSVNEQWMNALGRGCATASAAAWASWFVGPTTKFSNGCAVE